MMMMMMILFCYNNGYVVHVISSSSSFFDAHLEVNGSNNDLFVPPFRASKTTNGITSSEPPFGLHPPKKDRATCPFADHYTPIILVITIYIRSKQARTFLLFVYTSRLMMMFIFID